MADTPHSAAAPNKGDDPSKKCPAEQDVEGHDPTLALMAPLVCDGRGEHVSDRHNEEDKKSLHTIPSFLEENSGDRQEGQ